MYGIKMGFLFSEEKLCVVAQSRAIEKNIPILKTSPGLFFYRDYWIRTITLHEKRKETRVNTKRMALCLALTLCLIPWLIIAAHAEGYEPEPIYKTIEEMSGMKFAYVKGSVYDKYVESRIEDTTTLFYPSLSDCIAAVEAGKVDAAVQRSYALQLAINRRGGTVAMLPQTLSDMEEEYFFRHGDPRLEPFNAAIAKLMEDGTIAELTQKWASADDSIKTLPEQDWEAPNGTLKFVTTGTLEPFSYAGPLGKPIGFDVDLALHICREMGYKLQTEMVGMDAIVAAVQSGKADFGGTLTYTEERAKAVDFSDSVMPISVSVVVKAKAPAAGTDGASAGKLSMGERFMQSFRKTFIEESRWRLILNGLGTTVFISVFAGIFGFVLGFGSILLRRTNKRIPCAIVNAYHALFGSVPIVVILMVCYYVIFKKASISGEVVCIIAFSFAFGASSGTTLWTAISGIDAVQEESGLALGYTKSQTFRRIIFPQALQQCLAQLLGQFVSLVKDTSVVGFIAVMDLTRAGDLIRARTLEAFFPLLAIALIYFVECRILLWVIRKITGQITNKHRTIKGIKL